MPNSSSTKRDQYLRLRKLYPGLPEELNSASVEVVLALAIDTKIKYDNLLNK